MKQPTIVDTDVSKRLEYLHDLNYELKPVVYSVLYTIWKEVYKNTAIPQRYWLQKFQLALKKCITLENDHILQSLNKHSKKHLMQSLYHAYLLTGSIYHGEKPRIQEDEELLISFTKDVIIKTAREIWYVPYLFFYITHKKEKIDEGKELFDKLFTGSVKFTIRQHTNEMILAQRAAMEKHKSRLALQELEHQKSESEYSSEATSESASTTEVLSEHERHHDESLSENESVLSYPSTSVSKQDKLDKSKHESKFVEESIKTVPSIQKAERIEENNRYEEKYEIGEDGAFLKPTCISRQSSFKAILEDGDNSEDLFIPRKHETANKPHSKAASVVSSKAPSIKILKTVPDTPLIKPAEDSINQQNDATKVRDKSKPIKVEKEQPKKTVVIPQYKNIYYSGNPDLQKKLIKKVKTSKSR